MTINKIKLFLFFLLIAIATRSNGQSNVDSLKMSLGKATNDSSYVDILNELTKIYKKSDPLIALDYAIKAQKISQSCNYSEGQVLAYFYIADLYAAKGNNELAIENYTNSLKISQVLNNKTSIANAYSNIGLIYRFLKQYEKALECHNKSLGIKKELRDSVGIANEYENLGLLYFDQGKYDKALINFYNSLRLKETINDKYGMAHTYENIGTIYYRIESIDQAQVNFERSLMLFEQTEDSVGISNTLIFLGDIYARQNLSSKALEVLTRSIEINTNRDYQEGLADAYLKTGIIYASIKKPFLAYNNFINSLTYYEKVKNLKGVVLSRLSLANYYYGFDDFENAQAQLSKALPLAQTQNYLKEEYDLLKLLANIYLKQENYFKTSTTLVRANVLSDSLWRIKLENEIDKNKIQFEFEKKMQQKELEDLKLDNLYQLRSQKIQIAQIFVIVVFFLIIILSFLFYKKSMAAKKKNTILEEQKKQIQLQIEALTHQKAELEKANVSKDKFMTIIGNDLRNLFNTINSFTSQLTEQPKSFDDTTILKYLLLIKDAGSDAMNLLENLMEWAKTQTGEILARKEDVPLNYILRGNILLIREMARQKNIELIDDLSRNPIVNIDKNMINTVIRNLLSNALKFTDNGGTIWIKTIINNDEIKVIVQDTGIGISEERLSHIFEEGAINRGIDGTVSSGLGLILCKEFLHQHRQELRVDSKINFGTTFWFYLPLSE